MQIGSRLHQDRVEEIDDLVVGDELWIFKEDVEDLYPSYRKQLAKSNEILKIRISSLSQQHRWDGERVIFVENEILGQIAMPISLLRFSYRRPDYQMRSPFKKNEWVQVGSRERPIIVRRTGQPFALNLKLGQFLEMMPDGRYLVKMTQYGPNYVLLSKDVYGLNTGTKEIFDQAVDPFLELRYSFSPGDVALARLTNGEIIEVLVEQNLPDGRYRISIPDGKTFDVRQRVLSRIVGDRKPRTWTHRINGQISEEKIHGTPLQDFFDGARKMVSHPDFKSLSDLQKLKLVVRYVNRFLKEDHEVAYDRTMDPTDELICVGVAVCNHKAYVTANILSEAGFESSVGTAFRESDGAGHAWAIARMPEGETYYVDPGKRYDILTIWQAKKIASEDSDSLAAEFYTNSDRKMYSLKRSD